MTYLEAQLEQTKAYIVLWQTEILSGAYKQKQLFKGGASTAGPETAMTDDEKLKHCMDILKGHVSNMYKITEKIGEAAEADSRSKHEAIRSQALAGG
jgi:hypothetical protein